MKDIPESAKTDEILFDVLTGGGRTFSFPYYFIQEGETLWTTAYADSNAMGVGIDSENLDRKRKGDEGNLYIFLDSRIFIIFCYNRSVGEANKQCDEYLNLMYENVDDVEVSSGLTKNRISLDMDEEYDGESYHIWMNTDTDISAIERVAHHITENDDFHSLDVEISGTLESFNPEHIAESDSESSFSDWSDMPLKYISESGNTPEAIKQGIEKSSEVIRNNLRDGEGENEGPIDKIERLAELKEQGIITEKEFEEKKSELLDKV